MAPFARKCEQIFVAACLAFDSGKAEVQIAALQVSVDNILYIRLPEPQAVRISIVPNLFQFFEMRFNALVEATGARIAWAVDANVRMAGDWLSHKKMDKQTLVFISNLLTIVKINVNVCIGKCKAHF